MLCWGSACVCFKTEYANGNELLVSEGNKNPSQKCYVHSMPIQNQSILV